MMRAVVLTAALACALSACGGPDPSPSADSTTTPATTTKSETVDPSIVSKADMGKKWPLTVSHGHLVCTGSKSSAVLVFVAPNGVNYALNGTAKAALDHAADIDDIWADSADAGLKKDLGPLIDRGFKVC